MLNYTFNSKSLSGHTQTLGPSAYYILVHTVSRRGTSIRTIPTKIKQMRKTNCDWDGGKF